MSVMLIGCASREKVAVCEHLGDRISSKIEIKAINGRIEAVTHTISVSISSSDDLSFDQFSYLDSSIEIKPKTDRIDFVADIAVDDLYDLQKTIQNLKDEGYKCYD